MRLKSLLLLMVLCASAPAYADLEGHIVNLEGEAISGAVVEVVGTGLSVTTDENGYFELGDVDPDAELHISAIGYVHQTILLDGSEIDAAQPIVLLQSIIEQMDVVGIPLHVSSIESAVPISVLAGEELRSKLAATLGDSLAGEVGVHSSFHGNVASTPIIRGLSGPRVLVAQNSLDVSDVSREGPDHTVTTELSNAERVEILRGPATLFFGSGAIGGVVNVVDNRVPTSTETGGEWLLSTDSVNGQDLASINLNTGAGNLGFHFDGFWREADDYDVPVYPEIGQDQGERTVASTAEESSGFTFGTSYLLDNGFVGFSYGTLERDHGIPGHGHGEEEHDEEEHEEGDIHLEAEGEEEQVVLALEQDRYQLLSELSFDHTFFRSLNTRIGYTDYEHTEFESGSVGTTFANETGEAKLELLHQPQHGWNGGFILDYKSTEFSAVGEEAFAPPSETDSFAIAFVEERHFGDVLVQMGARIERVDIASTEVAIADIEFLHAGDEHDEEEHGHDEEEHGHGEEVFSFDEDYTPFSLSVGAVWDFAPGYNVGVSLSRAERAPSAAELLSFGPHIATGTFEIGGLFEAHEEGEEVHFDPIAHSPEMEESTNIDISFRKFEGTVGIILNAFYNKVDNYYALFDTGLVAEFEHAHDEEEEHHEEEHHEEDEHHEEGGHGEAGEELPVLLFQSADASLFGFEAQGVWQVNPLFKATVFADYVSAELDAGGHLPRIPPLRFGARFEYADGPLSANLGWTHYSDQDDVAVLETETDGYDWVDASLNYRIPLSATDLTLFVKAENLTDEEARVHSSFLKNLAPRPGRNFRVGIRGSF